MSELLLLILLIFLVITAAFAIFVKSIIKSIIILSVFSINLTVIFLILQAPDVAMTEAVIGAGLITMFFVVTINKTEES